ncbi:MAG: LPS export ABC transporter periplasmic protein LptC [Gemmatimonadota bacterium]
MRASRLAVILLLVLGGCAKRGIAPKQAAVGDSADQVMGGMQTTVTDNDLRVLDLRADTARVYQNRQVADLENVTVTFYDKSGQATSTVTSRRGSYAIRDKSLDLRDSVVARTPTGKVLRTEHLVYDRIANQVRSDVPFTFTGPDGDGAGASFESDPDFRNVITLRPRGRQKGKGFLLPGQDAPKPQTPAARGRVPK